MKSSRKRRPLPKAYMAELRFKQGNLCFYCHTPMGNDATFEHFRSVSSHPQWQRRKRNLRAAHEKCNMAAGSLPPPEKNRLSQIGRSRGREAFFQQAALARREYSQSNKFQPQYWARPRDALQNFRNHPPEFLTRSIGKSRENGPEA